MQLKPQLALSMATVLHELRTNAAKYGALSSASGHVELQWAISRVAPEQLLKIVWQESGGPDVVPPARKGFGMRVIESSLLQEHQAQVSLTFPPQGVKCEIEIPVREVD